MSTKVQAELKNKLKNMTPQEKEAYAQMIAGLLNQDVPTKTEVLETMYSKDTKKIIIPDTMDKLQASEELERQWHEEENIVEVSKAFEGWDYKDVLAAVARATEEHFGWVNSKATYTFFGKQLPKFITVVTDIKDGQEITTECFYGKVVISAWDDAEMNISINSASNVTVKFDCKKKFKTSVNEYFQVINKELRERSIYRGRSVALESSQWGGVEYQIFENKSNPKIFLTKGNEIVLRDFILPDITEKGKRCYLFTGDYGTGKTETAMRIGEYGNKNNMSFLYLKDADRLDDAILLCRNYDPCILFLEDLDEVAAGERGTSINKILNTLDGVQSKNSNVKVIFTTNHEDKINSAFRRPGRIDQILKFEYPDLETKAKIAHAFLHDLEGYSDEMNEKGVEYFPEAQGAVVAEICKRIRKLSLMNGGVILEYYHSSTASIQPQLELMKTDAVKPTTTVSTELEKLVAAQVSSQISDMENTINYIKGRV